VKDFQAALAIDEKALGPNHPNLAMGDLNGLGQMYIILHRTSEARTVLERALRIISGADVSPKYRGGVELALARALWAFESERPRARKLAEAARERFRAGSDHELEESASKWLAHPSATLH
jgi:hypothetical protein